ncbi:MAG: tetratricopeptide repeat protein [Chthoniobacteraceae bacterium]
MTTSPDSEIIPLPGFDPLVFWMQHKGKILIYAAILVIALVSVVAYQIISHNRLVDSQQLFAQATSEDDYRQIVQKYPHTIAAGNASLMLAEKLRDEKKYDEAISTLQALIDQSPEYPFLDAAWLSQAATLEVAGRTDEALSKYQQTASKFATSYSAPQALLAEAAILKGKGKPDEAKHIFENVKSQFPNSFFAADAMQQLEQLKK